MRAMRIVLLKANGVWLPDFAYHGASRVYYLATYPTTHDLIFVSVLLANAIPTVVGSLTLAGNIAYIWRSRPHAACRIVLLIANGVWLPIYAVGAPSSVYVLATRTHDYPVAEAIANTLCAFSSWPAASPTSGALGRTHTMKKGQEGPAAACAQREHDIGSAFMAGPRVPTWREPIEPHLLILASWATPPFSLPAFAAHKTSPTPPSVVCAFRVGLPADRP